MPAQTPCAAVLPPAVNGKAVVKCYYAKEDGAPVGDFCTLAYFWASKLCCLPCCCFAMPNVSRSLACSPFALQLGAGRPLDRRIFWLLDKGKENLVLVHYRCCTGGGAGGAAPSSSATSDKAGTSAVAGQALAQVRVAFEGAARGCGETVAVCV